MPANGLARSDPDPPLAQKRSFLVHARWSQDTLFCGMERLRLDTAISRYYAVVTCEGRSW